MEGTNSKADFQDQFFSPESVASFDMNDPEKNYFNDKLQDTGFPYFSKQLKHQTSFLLFVIFTLEA